MTADGPRTKRATRRSGQVAAEEELRRADPVLGRVIDEVIRDADGLRPMLPPDPARPRDPNIPTDRYGVLVRAIVSQNISNFSSRAIFRKLKERYDGEVPGPEQILAEDPDELRQTAGLSRAKMASLRSLADHILSGELDLDRLPELADEDVVTQLSAVKGIGVWTADMFLMFNLYRPDVLPVGDLELRRTAGKVYGLPQAPSPAELTRMAEPWRPYRTLACVYLWQWAEKEARL